MHVAYIIGQDSGGLPHYTAELANAVAEHADVTVLKPTETTADDLFDDDVELLEVFSKLELSTTRIYRREISPRRVLDGLRSYDAVEAIRQLNPDIVHDPTDLFAQVKFYLKRHGIDAEWPIVVTRHEVEHDRFSLARPTHFAEELVLAAIPDLDISRTVVHTESQKRALADRGQNPESISVVPHGVYTVFGDGDDVEIDPEDGRLLFFGNIVPHKGLATLVEAIPRVAAEYPEVTLVIAGEGRIPDRARAIIDEYDQHFEVHNYFVPNEDVGEHFGRAQLAVLPYHERAGGTNGHSGVLATAVSFGTPVVTSRAGDFPDLVEGYDCGLTVPSQDPERLASAILELLRDDESRARMAANSRRLADDLSWDGIAERYHDLYRTVVGEKGSADRQP